MNNVKQKRNKKKILHMYQTVHILYTFDTLLSYIYIYSFTFGEGSLATIQDIASHKHEVKVQPIGVFNISHMLLSLHWARFSVSPTDWACVMDFVSFSSIAW